MKDLNKVLTEVNLLLEEQRKDILGNNYDIEVIENIIFSENDIVENYLKENLIEEHSIDLEALRNLQHNLINELKK